MNKELRGVDDGVRGPRWRPEAKTVSGVALPLPGEGEWFEEQRLNAHNALEAYLDMYTEERDR